MAELPLDRLIQEVETGLQNEQHRLNDATMGQAFYDYEGKRFMSVFLKDAETPFDYLQRPYRASGLAHEAVDILTDHLYCPGPSRTWTDAAGQEFLHRVYQDNHVDALMLRADQLSTLNDCAAIQIDAADGNFGQFPLKLRVWGAEEFHAWTDPDDRTCPKAVCTIDRYDLATRFRLWTDDEVLTFETKKAELMQGGRTAKLVGREPNSYGCLPFGFVHYEQPVQRFWQAGIGALIVQAEIRINDRMSRIDESINKHLNPIPVAQNVPDNWQMILEAQRFLKLSNSKMRVGPTGGYEEGPEPKLYYLQAQIDVAGAWDDLHRYLSQILEAARLPVSAVRMEQQGVSSGIALVVEQAPLLTRARRRRGPFSIYESHLAKTILTCAGNHYGKPALLRSALTGSLSLGWPQASVPIPTDDRLQLLQGEVASGMKSMLMGMQEWFGVDRNQALEIAKQIEVDNTDLAAINPRFAASLNPETDEDDTEGATEKDSDKPSGDENADDKDESEQSHQLNADA